jgi:hypothetical protein
MSLTDDELTRYGQIATDQYRREARLWWAQGILSIVALAWAFWGIHGLLAANSARAGVLTLGLSVVLGYWPYRKAKSRRLWWGHCSAVQEEQRRRRASRASRQVGN